MTLFYKLGAGGLIAFALSACSSDTDYHKTARGGVDYLETPQLKPWLIPEGTSFEPYIDYEIPIAEFSGAVGNEIDIRSPQQVLALIPGAQIEYEEKRIHLLLVEKSEADAIWQIGIEMLQEKNIEILNQTETVLETGRIEWMTEDDEEVVGSRYRLTQIEKSNRYGIAIELLELDKMEQQAKISALEETRYNVFAANLITATYDQQEQDKKELQAGKIGGAISFYMGTDRSGLPIIIARSTYDESWLHLPELLVRMGFEIDDQNQSQGTIESEYTILDEEFWTSIGLAPLNIEEEDYIFLLGDLGNRTSINITDMKGAPVDEQILCELVPVFMAVSEL